MMIKSADAVYEAVENALHGAKSPMTCASIMDDPEVRKAALERFGNDAQVATNKLSDVLGYMWRRGILDRYPAPPSRSMARYAYALKNQNFGDGESVELKPIDRLGKHALSITEKNGEVILDFQQFTIIVRPKP